MNHNIKFTKEYSKTSIQSQLSLFFLSLFLSLTAVIHIQHSDVIICHFTKKLSRFQSNHETVAAINFAMQFFELFFYRFHYFYRF